MKKILSGCLFLFAACSQKPGTLFERMPETVTGIQFNNQVTENDSINPMDMEFLYNGGGVAIGDFNQDGLPDIYFTASQLSNRLYLNKGNFNFEDITELSGTSGGGKWSNAASVVDINNDGLADIYVCASIRSDAAGRQNILYINQGLNEKGVPVFKDEAEAYGLADTSMSVQAAFFDYDNDGDQDLYLVNTKLAQRNSTRFDSRNKEIVSTMTDRLYRNEGIPTGKTHPVFKDVSAEAGIRDEGFGLAVSIADFNDDGWKDIYVTNDFFTSDLLYINQGNGRFTDEAMTVLKHTSQSAMGNDVADINNDGLPDILAVDMNPEDNYRKKKNLVGNNYFYYQSMSASGIIYQYVRNTLQLHQGIRTADSGQKSLPVFSEIAYLSGIAETDWSWSPLIADFDNDGFKDILVTNGYPKDVTDNDFIVYNKRFSILASKQDILDQIPQIKISNYAFRNTGTLKFENETSNWGLSIPSFSAGAAYADLDLDGDLDYIVNNINDPAFVFRNNSNKLGKRNYLDIAFKGPALNLQGLGATVSLFRGDSIQVQENYPYRGYLSSMAPKVHFGLGSQAAIDSLVITWPDGKRQAILNPTLNQQLVVSYSDAADRVSPAPKPASFFTEISNRNLQYLHKETDFIDFDIQQLLPHKLSEYGPALAVADADGNGLDDLLVGGSAGNSSLLFMQQPDGRFVPKALPSTPGMVHETAGMLFFDANQDGFPDLYLASGSNEFAPQSAAYQDRFFRNDGKGNFIPDSNALPVLLSSTSCVKAADYDHDGDLDLFIGVRSIPHRYPAAASSFLLRNDSNKDQIKFTDVSTSLAPGLTDLGLVCDAIWSDYDNDGWVDLLIAGEWMAPTLFHNNQGKLEAATNNSGLAGKTGWWTSIASGDFDNDGDQDYVIGNQGGNSFYKGDSLFPANIYGGDFGHNKSYVVIPSLYLPNGKGKKQEFTAHSRNDLVNQLPALKKKYLSYKSFGEASFQQIFTAAEIGQAYKKSANYPWSAWMENLGGGKFALHALPEIAQFAPLNGMLVKDVNADGALDLLIVGNDFGTEVSTGRYDACNGILLLGDGKGAFRNTPLEQSGFYVPGNAKALVSLRAANGDFLLAASQNRDQLKLFRANQQNGTWITLQPGDLQIRMKLKDGRQRVEERYWGNSFYSQSSSQIFIPENVQHLSIVNKTGNREIPF